ncbi:MAG: CRISPR-associated endonuclease Cas2 [bacterium]|nr:CRISPR-associated endonuclease Cas2 [bacterium]
MEPRKIKLKPISQKILLLLTAGVVLGLTRSPRQYFRILKAVKKDWDRINQDALHRAIKTLYRSKLVDSKDNTDGSVTLVLTKLGKETALTYQIDEIKIPPMKRWDKKWRLVLFDIPESRKKARNALSRALKQAGFAQFQKSVFIHPFECRNEADFIIEFFNLRPYVRFITADEIDNGLAFKKHFELN